MCEQLTQGCYAVCLGRGSNSRPSDRGDALRFVKEFKYLGHIISDSLADDSDILREVRNMFVRSNILKRFAWILFASQAVKVALFRIELNLPSFDTLL